jgi:hypothetical protein
MKIIRTGVVGVALIVGLGWLGAMGIEAAAPESKRLVRARDFIADEQWALAIEQLRAAVGDPKETRRDEALYWLAHSQHHSGDSGAAVATIGRLEREYPSSMWVKPGQALRIEIAVRLQRNDVLWWTAMPPPPPPAPRSPSKKGGPTPLPPAPPVPSADPVLAPPPAPLPPASRAPRSAQPAPPIPPPAPMWYTDSVSPDADIRVLALAGLMRTDADKVIPILGQIAFETENPASAIRAVSMLAQSSRPQARATVVRVAKTGPEPVKIAAVRDLARFGGPEVSKDLLQVYATANDPVKWQIVKSLGEIEARFALFDIVKSEKEGKLRVNAIMSLGRAGGVEQLAALYGSSNAESRRSIINGLFHASAESQLIKIAEFERKAGNDELRREAVDRLKLLGTPKATDYLQKVAEKR